MLGNEGLWADALYGCVVSVSCESALCAFRESDRDLSKNGEGSERLG